MQLLEPKSWDVHVVSAWWWEKEEEKMRGREGWAVPILFIAIVDSEKPHAVGRAIEKLTRKE